MKRLNDFLKDKPIGTLLDVGTGSGNFIPYLSDAMPGAKITGVDPNVESLEEARVAYPEVDFLEMKGEKLLFGDNKFDVASISMALHHLPNVVKTLSEMQRVVKPGGWIVVNELFADHLNAAQEVQKTIHHWRSRIDRLKGVAHNETFKKQEILERVEKAGLKTKLHFEHKKGSKTPTARDIAEHKEKLKSMLEEIKEFPEYHELLKEIPGIERALDEHGYEMATRIVIVAEVHKNYSLSDPKS